MPGGYEQWEVLSLFCYTEISEGERETFVGESEYLW